MDPTPDPPLRNAMREALATAMKHRDRVATAALRSALAEIDNAEAVDSASAPRAQPGRIAGAVAGLGAGEVARRTMTDDDVRAIVGNAVVEREAAAAQYEALHRPDDANRLRLEAAVLSALLGAD